MSEQAKKPAEELPPPDYSKEMTPDEVRIAVRGVMSRRGMTQKEAGLEAGVGETTMQAFMAGKYLGNNEKQAQKLQLWLFSEQSLSRTRAAVTEIEFAPTKTSAKILNALHHAQSLADMAVVSGGAGVGKTTSCRQHKATHPNVWIITAEPMISSAFAMLECLRDTLNIPETTPHKLSRAISGKVASTGGLIIVDEAQHVKVPAYDQLRSIHDQAGIGLAFVGNEEVWGQIDGGGRSKKYAQIYSRVGIRASIAKASPRDAEAILDASGVHDAGVRALLKTIAAKPGALRGMVKTLRNARFLAHGNEEELGEAHIHAAWARYEGSPEVAA